MRDALVIRNNMAIVGWVFCGIWVGGLVVFTWLFARDGGFNQFDPFVESGVMLFFWLGALVLIAELMTKPRVRFVLERRSGRIWMGWVFRRQEEAISAQTLRALEISQERDSDGDPYFVLNLKTPSGREAVLSESGNRARVEAVLRDIQSRL